MKKDSIHSVFCLKVYSVDFLAVLFTQICSTVRDCYGTERKCENGINIYRPWLLQCYEDTESCDSVVQCTDASDETSCPCPQGYTKCFNG